MICCIVHTYRCTKREAGEHVNVSDLYAMRPLPSYLKSSSQVRPLVTLACPCSIFRLTVLHTMMASIDVDAFTEPFQLTKFMHRELYTSPEPSNPSLNASVKVVLVTGAGGKVGGVSNARSMHLLFLCRRPSG